MNEQKLIKYDELFQMQQKEREFDEIVKFLG